MRKGKKGPLVMPGQVFFPCGTVLDRQAEVGKAALEKKLVLGV